MYKINKNQKGFAVLVTVLMSGVAILGMTMRMGSSQKSQQQVQRVENTSVSSQIRAWEASEVIKSYLGAHSDPASLPVGNLEITGLDGVRASITNNSIVNGNRRIILDIKASSTSGTSTVLESVYQMGVGTPTTTPILNNTITSGAHFNGDLNLNGALWATGKPNITVTGNLTSTNVSMPSSVGTVCAGGDINVKGFFDENVCSIGNFTGSGSGVIISGSANIGGNFTSNAGRFNILNIKGNANITNNETPVQINLEGNVSLTNAFLSTLNANGNVDWSSKNPINTINSGGYIKGQWNGTGQNVQNMNAVGEIVLGSFQNAINVKTNSNINLEGQSIISTASIGGNVNLSWSNSIINTGTYGGNRTGQINTSSLTKIAGHTPGLTSPGVVVTIPKINKVPEIDARSLKSSANFIYSYDYLKSNISVNIFNINGINNGDYYIGSFGAKKNYICKDALNGICISTPVIDIPIAITHSGYNHLDAFFHSGNTLTIAGSSHGMIIPGVHYFDGNLKLDMLYVAIQPEYTVGTFIATEDITLTSMMKLRSPNMVGYQNVCNNQNFKSGSIVFYPKQFCNTNASQFIKNDIGDIVLLSGTPTSGGVVKLNLSGIAEIWGTIVAGNNFFSDGPQAPDISGSIVAGGQIQTSSQNKTGINGIKINITDLPSTYSSTTLICMANCTATTGSTGSAGASVLWSRYK